MPEEEVQQNVPPETPPQPRTKSGLWNAISWARDLVFSVLIAVVLIVFIGRERLAGSLLFQFGDNRTAGGSFFQIVRR